MVALFCPADPIPIVGFIFGTGVGAGYSYTNPFSSQIVLPVTFKPLLDPVGYALTDPSG